jgi:hypothetical protein
MRRLNVSDETKEALAEAMGLEQTVRALRDRLAGRDEPELPDDALEDGVLYDALVDFTKDRQREIVRLANGLLDAKDGAR